MVADRNLHCLLFFSLPLLDHTLYDFTQTTENVLLPALYFDQSLDLNEQVKTNLPPRLALWYCTVVEGFQ